MAVHLNYISFRILVSASVWSMWKIAVVYIYKGDLNIVDVDQRDLEHLRQVFSMKYY